MNRNYQVVINMDRALGFYTKLFQNGPMYSRNDFSLFKIKRKIFVLIEKESSRPYSIDQDETLLILRTEDIKAEFERIKLFGFEMDEQISESDGLYFFHFQDSEANVIKIIGF